MQTIKKQPVQFTQAWQTDPEPSGSAGSLDQEKRFCRPRGVAGGGKRGEAGMGGGVFVGPRLREDDGMGM
ncbi:hypothetical protein QMTAC487_04870 [Sphaerotilus sp. FB-3]|nr:hypothetical protein QMTAC487_04870 [Sphaerotilus sp. FB-3]